MAKKQKPPPGPDDLVREAAGAYVPGDGRFTISQSDATWFVVDTEQANEFGQELIHGPYSSLKQAQASLAGARTVKPLLRSVPRSSRSTKSQARQPATKPPPPPPTWIDRLDAADQREVRSLIRALEREGLPAAEDLVRNHRADVAPTIATRLLEHRLRQLIDSAQEQERSRTVELVERAIEILTVDGPAVARPLPGWALVEVASGEPPPKRRIRPRP